MLRLIGTTLLMLSLVCLNDFAHGQPQTKTRYGDSLKKLDVEGVRRALKEGADPNERYGGRGSSVLDSVLFYGLIVGTRSRPTQEHEEKIIAVLEVLFGAGAHLETDILHVPAMRGASLVTKYLLDRGANPDGVDGDGNTPVILATKYGHPNILALLASYGAKPLNPVTETQIKFISAARRGDLIAMRRELEKGATVDDRSPTGETALVEAIEGGRFSGGNFKVVIELLRLGANPNLPGRYHGQTSPLHVAVFNNEQNFETDNGPAVVEALLKAGAHVSSTNYIRQRTPLHVAAQLQNSKAVEILLKAGAKVMPRDADGKTPLDYAESASVIRLLKAAGAKEQ